MIYAVKLLLPSEIYFHMLSYFEIYFEKLVLYLQTEEIFQIILKRIINHKVNKVNERPCKIGRPTPLKLWPFVRGK